RPNGRRLVTLCVLLRCLRARDSAASIEELCAQLRFEVAHPVAGQAAFIGPVLAGRLAGHPYLVRDGATARPAGSRRAAPELEFVGVEPAAADQRPGVVDLLLAQAHQASSRELRSEAHSTSSTSVDRTAGRGPAGGGANPAQALPSARFPGGRPWQSAGRERLSRRCSSNAASTSSSRRWC